MDYNAIGWHFYDNTKVPFCQYLRRLGGPMGGVFVSVFSYLRCPVCGGGVALSENGRSLLCERRHTFDLAAAGYVNLLAPGKKNNAVAGDPKEMVRARSLFLASGAYDGISDGLNRLIGEGGVCVDCGCGEGFYTARAAAQCKTVIGFDASKFAAEHGAKCARRAGQDNLHFFTANIFDLPLRDGCADTVINLFAPVAREEFLRVLKPGGRLIVGAAGKRHLMGMKRILYETPYENEENDLVLEGFERIHRQTVYYETTVTDKEAIRALFMMTPYYFRTSREDADKLYACDTLTTEVETDFFVFRKID